MFGISYWFLPAFAGTVWLGTLLGMLLWWVRQGSPHYPWMSDGQNVAFISSIGASSLKPLFIAGSATMVVIFDLAFISERWLRHKGRLALNETRLEKALSVCAIILALIGGAGLILLSIFDTNLYPTIHNAMLALFIGGYVFSAIFICAEYQRLGMNFREYRILRISFWIKLVFIFVEIALAIPFGVLQAKGGYGTNDNISAYLEWIISLVYIFYVWSFVIDFLPATRTKNKEDRFPHIRRDDDEVAETTEAGGNMLGGPVFSTGGHQHGGAIHHGADASSYGSAQPMAQSGGRYYPPQSTSTNF